MNFRSLAALDAHLRGGLVVSCQPVDGGPMDHTGTVVRLALAAVAGGARGLRIEGAERVKAVRAATTAPIIGIIKRDLQASPVRITPWVEDVAALAIAGADVIAVDATLRERPASVDSLLKEINAHGALSMADCANISEIRNAHAAGFDIVGTTLSGYVGGEVPNEPDYDLLSEAISSAPRVMAEGRYNSPAEVAKAISLGAWAVTVGTAITRTEVVTGWFVDATRR